MLRGGDQRFLKNVGASILAIGCPLGETVC